MPGETLGCVGCHEPRTQIPPSTPKGTPRALRRPASRIAPFHGFSDVLDYRRDVQPILDRRCVACHSDVDRQGHILLTEDLGVRWSISYYSLLAAGQVADGRNGLGNQKPRTIGSSASRLLRMIDGSHYDVTVTPEEWRTLWLWIESGAPYAGTYAGIRNAEDQAREGPGYAVFRSAVLDQTCRRCHGQSQQAPPLPVAINDKERDETVRRLKLAPYERIVLPEDLRYSAHVLVSLSRPDRSPLLLGPLSKSAGGWGSCAHRFEGTQDPDYQRLLSEIRSHKTRLAEAPAYGMSGFRPNRQYIREMKRFGVLPAHFDAVRDPIDVFRVDQRYWRSFWYEPQGKSRWPYLD